MPDESLILQVLGVYRVDATPSLVEEAMELKYPGDSSPENRHSVTEEISSAVLVEVLATEVESSIDVDAFGQPGSDQAPYMERYLSVDGNTLLSEWEQPRKPSFRVCFYLHFYQEGLSLESSAGLLDVPSVERMPDRLRELAPYEPVD